ncbi:uncharacterized protein LOC105831100 [Monomorium pharaonis]|uniref:uncharacterized protein LOC105831100 n=1 Tax=Monomorium pharaonis TaxID=307658 RepID=UPI00063FB291|nr:uncharacterized protein LOC105831100 [Monomorium pharaonis]
MRVQLLLILFFASTILARSARNKRDVTTVQPSSISTTKVNNENTTTGVTTGEDECREIICVSTFQPLKMTSKFYKTSLMAINNTLAKFRKAINTMSNFALGVMMQLIVTVIQMMMRMIKSLMRYF